MSTPRIGHWWPYPHRDDAVAGVGQGGHPPTPGQQDDSASVGDEVHRAEGVLVCGNEKAPNIVGAFLPLFAGVHPPYAAEAFLFTPLRVATVFSLVFAAFSSLRFVVRRRTTS